MFNKYFFHIFAKSIVLKNFAYLEKCIESLTQMQNELTEFDFE